ncbi:MAG: DUF4249 family protein [Gemmatimonadetes bacterium]|nr:DUF4249 family protein [Gemmatimonadota bacterium]
MKYFVLMMGCLIALVGCKAERDPSSLFGPDASGVLVVDVLLIVDNPLPQVLVSETVKANVGYSKRWAGVGDAEVVISQGEQTFMYRPSSGFSTGSYRPPLNAPLVLPNTTYHLRVRSQGREATAQTVTPGRLNIREAVLLDDETLEVIRELKKYEDSAVFDAPENRLSYQLGLLEMRFDPLPASGYQIAIESLDHSSDFLVDSDLFDEYDFERYGSSPALEAPDGNLRMPWFIVGFAGRHVVHIYAVDKNWFDLIRSVPEFFQDEGENAFQPGGLAGDNFERPLFNVDGGIGIFGSASVDSVGFVVLPRPSQ